MGAMPRVYRRRESRATAKCKENLAVVSIAIKELNNFSREATGRAIRSKSQENA